MIIFEQEYLPPASNDEAGKATRIQYNKWEKARFRVSAPPSFLSRIPFQMILLATVLGLCFLSGIADAQVQSGFFPQLLDHANAQNKETFQQRYWKRNDYWENSPKKGAHMVIISVSSFASEEDLQDSGLTYWAQKIQATLFELETRYTGKSFPDFLTSKLTYDTVDQHVQDLASFILYCTQSDSSLVSARWIVVGSFFDGADATWFRSQYPSLAFGSISISPYLVATLENPEYDLAYQAFIGPTCASAINQTMADLSAAFKSAAFNKTKYEQKCGCVAGDVRTDQEFFFVVSQLIIGNLWNPVVCNNITQAPANANGRLENFARLISGLLSSSYANCGGWNIAKDDGNQTFRSSLYLMCSQLGQFQTAPKTGVSLHTRELDLAWYLSVCKEIFNDSLPSQPDVALFNAAHGGANPSGCNMVFVTSTNDPYTALGPDATAVRKTSSTNQVITVDCPEPLVNLGVLSAPSSDDRSCVTDAREKILNILRKWQIDAVACPVPSGDGGDDKTAAIVGPLAALAGIIVGVVIGGFIVFYASKAALNQAKRYAWTKIN